MVKISKMHQRVLGKQAGSLKTPSRPGIQVITTPKDTPVPRRVLDDNNTSYVAYMSQNAVMRMGHGDAYVISVRDEGACPYEFDCKKQLTLYLDTARKPSDESVAQFKDFLKEVLKEERIIIHVHCNYGETRSASIAEAISYGLYGKLDVEMWQVQNSGKWVTGSEMTNYINSDIYRAFARATKSLLGDD